MAYFKYLIHKVHMSDCKQCLLDCQWTELEYYKPFVDRSGI